MKKSAWIFSSVVLMTIIWYLFVRPYEYEVNFNARTLPGDIIQTIRIWDRSLSESHISQVDSLFGLEQHITREGRSYIYNWHFLVIDDSTTRVNIAIRQPGRSVLNKLLVPVSDTQIEKDTRAIARSFHTILNTHLRITSVKVVGETTTSAITCVCRSVITGQTEKAKGMMREYGFLTAFVRDFDLRTNGPPVVRVTQWNHSSGKLAFDFCFPVAKTERLPMVDSITYKEFGGGKAIKAIYRGNYITSDRAWYALIRFSQTNGYEIDGFPLEYFYDNPNLGFNEAEWKTEIFLPVK